MCKQEIYLIRLLLFGYKMTSKTDMFDKNHILFVKKLGSYEFVLKTVYPALGRTKLKITHNLW